MARIFARELNRSDSLTEEEAIGEAILRGTDLDVIEIDGASNRGVQEARDLIAASGLTPTRCKYRIYIIDEVHMLTTPAFNALLKTMEEPPSHVKFILCTTEPHKVPATIQSRCQRFDFRAITSTKIASHLAFVLKEEGIQADDEVVAEVARLGNGSMRDALSILDRLLAGGLNEIKHDDMEELLGLPSQLAVSNLLQAIATSNLQSALEAADSLLASGVSLDRVLDIVSTVLRNSLIALVCGADSTMLELSEESRTEVVAIGKALDEAILTHMIALCDASSRQVRRAGSGRALFDATIARLCLSGHLAEAGGVLQSGVTAKKKRVTPFLPRKTERELAQVAETSKLAEHKQHENKTATTPESLFDALASTPGLKRIAQYLTVGKFEGSSVEIRISDEGRESANYILGQQTKIEEVIRRLTNRQFAVTIKTPSQQQNIESANVNIDSVEGDDLVQTARGLFEGTVVQVKHIGKGKQ